VVEDVELNRNVDLCLTTLEEMTSNSNLWPNEIENRGNGTLGIVHVRDILIEVLRGIIYMFYPNFIESFPAVGRNSLISRFLIRKSKPVAQVLISANQIASPCQS
jgi:hypothetical protein